jgi:hypothetical protein
VGIIYILVTNIWERNRFDQGKLSPHEKSVAIRPKLVGIITMNRLIKENSRTSDLNSPYAG